MYYLPNSHSYQLRKAQVITEAAFMGYIQKSGKEPQRTIVVLVMQPFFFNEKWGISIDYPSLGNIINICDCFFDLWIYR